MEKSTRFDQKNLLFLLIAFMVGAVAMAGVFKLSGMSSNAARIDPDYLWEQEPVPQIYSPVSTDIWNVDQTYNIQWDPNFSTSPRVRIELFQYASAQTNNRPGPTYPINVDTPNSGQYAWPISKLKIPSNLQNAPVYIIVSDSSGNLMQSATFKIKSSTDNPTPEIPTYKTNQKMNLNVLDSVYVEKFGKKTKLTYAAVAVPTLGCPEDPSTCNYSSYHMIQINDGEFVTLSTGQPTANVSEGSFRLSLVNEINGITLMAR